MSLAARVPPVCRTLGVATLGAALAWWAMTFWPPISNDYLSVAEAGRCLVADSSLCGLATSLCGTRHAIIVAAYSPLLLWLGAAVAFCGLWPAPNADLRAGAER